MMVQVEPIKAFNDNYIWCLHKPGENALFVVDPGDAGPVLERLSQGNETLAGILITHHHWDHTDGVAKLRQTYPDVPVYGPKHSPFKGITHPLGEGDELTVFDTRFRIIETPGHTLDHICYISDALCFCGDTLFSAGCGRLFEGSAEQMWQSLQKLSSLPDTCRVYCTHEYTQSNLKFAAAVEPQNRALTEYRSRVNALREQHLPSLPSTLGTEKAVNPFLRAASAPVAEHIPPELTPASQEPARIFAALRAWKDVF